MLRMTMFLVVTAGLGFGTPGLISHPEIRQGAEDQIEGSKLDGGEVAFIRTLPNPSVHFDCHTDCQVGAAAQPPCGTGRHRADAWPNSGFERGHGQHATCEPETCSDINESTGDPLHPECEVSEEQDLQLALEEVLRHPSWATVRTLLASTEHHVAVNYARGAIQVLRCNGQIRLHLPVSDDILAQISAAETPD